MLEGNAWNQGSSLKGLKGAATEGPEYVARGVFESRKTLGFAVPRRAAELEKVFKKWVCLKIGYLYPLVN